MEYGTFSHSIPLVPHLWNVYLAGKLSVFYQKRCTATCILVSNDSARFYCAHNTPARVKISQKFQGSFGLLVFKNWRPSFFFQGQIWFFVYLLYIRYWNEPTFWKAIWTLGLDICGPSPNVEGNWPEGPHQFDPCTPFCSHMWFDQAKSVWSRSNSVFIFLTNYMHHFHSYILQKTPLKLVNWF